MAVREFRAIQAGDLQKQRCAAVQAESKCCGLFESGKEASELSAGCSGDAMLGSPDLLSHPVGYQAFSPGSGLCSAGGRRIPLQGLLPQFEQRCSFATASPKDPTFLFFCPLLYQWHFFSLL